MIKVRDWKSYQSYKDRKPPWIRFHRDILDNYEYHSMSSDARALLPMLWLLASEDVNPLSGLIQISYEKICFRLRIDIMTFKSALKEICENGFAEIEDEAQVIENKACNETVTKPYSIRNQTVTPETETETETEYMVDFSEFWKLYPKRLGSNPKKPAEDKYKRLCKSGKKSEEIIDGVKKYAEFVRSSGNWNTPYVAQALTWLNQERWQDDYSEVPKSKQTVGFTPIGVGG